MGGLLKTLTIGLSVYLGYAHGRNKKSEYEHSPEGLEEVEKELF